MPMPMPMPILQHCLVQRQLLKHSWRNNQPSTSHHGVYVPYRPHQPTLPSTLIHSHSHFAPLHSQSLSSTLLHPPLPPLPPIHHLFLYSASALCLSTEYPFPTLQPSIEMVHPMWLVVQAHSLYLISALLVPDSPGLGMGYILSHP